MIVKNKTRKTILTSSLKEAISLLDLSLGLLRKSNPRSLMFRVSSGIHTFGLKKPIDVLVLNKSLKVVDLKQSLKPNRLFFWNPVYRIVLELPNGTIKKSNTKLADQITIAN